MKLKTWTLKLHTVALILIWLGCSLSIAALEWPVSGSELRSVFGQNESGRPSVGMYFSGSDLVRSANSGEMLFFVSGSSVSGLTQGFPHALGNWVAVDHGTGIISTYGHLAELESGTGKKTLVEKGSGIGQSGVSGWADRDTLFFSVFDRVGRCWLNPTVIAPRRADTKPPVIKTVTLIGRDGLNFNLTANRVVRQGVYRLLVEASDTEDRAPQNALAPYRMVCTVNGAEQGSLHLETIKVTNGELMVARIKPTQANLVYLSSGAFDLGDIRLTRGRTVVEIIAVDSLGNERSMTIPCVVE